MDWCITRNLEWGVKFPGRDDLVVYVWVDAPIGYISFTEEVFDGSGNKWEKYWKKKLGIEGHFNIEIQNLELCPCQHL